MQGLPSKGCGGGSSAEKLTYFGGDDSIKRVRGEWSAATGDKDKVAYLTLGFNPKAQAGFTMNNIVSGAVTLGLGGNEGVGGKNKSGFYFEHTLTGATVRAGGTVLTKDGQLLLQKQPK